MASLYKLFESVDVPLTNWMAHYGIMFLRVSLGALSFSGSVS